MTEIRCPKCGSGKFESITVPPKENPFVLDCVCERCGWTWICPTLDAPRVRVRGREDGYYWIQLNDVDDVGWEVGQWDGRVWARMADDEPVDESEVAVVGPRIPDYTP
jgi:hypothetical protein